MQRIRPPQQFLKRVRRADLAMADGESIRQVLNELRANNDADAWRAETVGRRLDSGGSQEQQDSEYSQIDSEDGAALEIWENEGGSLQPTSKAINS